MVVLGHTELKLQCVLQSPINNLKKVHEQVKMCEFGVLFNDACPHRHYDYDNTLERSCIRIYVHKYIYISKVLNVFHWKHHFKMCTRCANMTYVRSNKNIGFQIGKWNTNFWKLDTKKWWICFVDIYHKVCLPQHDDVMAWKRFPHYGPFVRGIHRLSVDSSHKESVMRSFHISFDVASISCWTCGRVAAPDLSDTYVMSL